MSTSQESGGDLYILVLSIIRIVAVKMTFQETLSFSFLIEFVFMKCFHIICMCICVIFPFRENLPFFCIILLLFSKLLQEEVSYRPIVCIQQFLGNFLNNGT